MSDEEKISFSERDKRRREKQNGSGKQNGGGHPNRGQQRSRSGNSRRRSRSAAAYKRKVEEQIFGRRGDAGKSRLEERLREAHQTPTFLRTYREYVKSFGLPEPFAVLILLLDLEDEREVVRVVNALGDGVEQATPDQRNLLRSRLRNLEMSASSDALGDAAADVLGRL